MQVAEHDIAPRLSRKSWAVVPVSTWRNLRQNVRKYNSKLNTYSGRIQSMKDAVPAGQPPKHGTTSWITAWCEMRESTMAGLLSVDDDIDRIKATGAVMQQYTQIAEHRRLQDPAAST